MSHSPGPWEIKSPPHKACSIWGADGKLIIHVVHGDDLGQRQDNARLIAAAPDMLEALELKKQWDLVGQFVYKGITYKAGINDVTTGRLLKTLRDNAIKKAKGI